MDNSYRHRWNFTDADAPTVDALEFYAKRAGWDRKTIDAAVTIGTRKLSPLMRRSWMLPASGPRSRTMRCETGYRWIVIRGAKDFSDNIVSARAASLCREPHALR